MAQKTPRRDDKFARESFTLRRMTPPQLWGITIAAAAVLIGAIIYGATI